jgi:lipoprotein-anchoring transpeptidase ErfK/SrfK
VNVRQLLLAVMGIAAVTAPASAAAARIPPPAERLKLSDERSHTRWAHPVVRAPAYSAPAERARRVARLRLVTEDGNPEVYLVRSSWADPEGNGWFHVRIPMRPNPTVGWVRASALGRLHLVRTHLTVDRARLRATLRRDERTVWTSRVGVGAPGTLTPAGSFWIRERIRVSPPTGLYGPWAFGTSAYSALSDWPGGGVVGIHGTDQPALIPGRPSHGCIRLPNPAVRRLARIMPLGTPVTIR